MLGVRMVTGAAGFNRKDPYWSNVISLLHFDGSSIVDEVSGVTWSATGSAALSATQSLTGGKSLYVPGIDSALHRSSSPGLGGNNFTVDGFVYFTSVGYRPIFAQPKNAGSGEQYVGAIDDGSSNLVAYVDARCGSPSGPRLKGSTLIPLSTWLHFEYSYDGSLARLFYEGVLHLSVSQGWINQTEPFAIGQNKIPLYSQYRIGLEGGYIDEFRITLGVARHTSNFTPPRYPFSHR